jgi:hypothetical protein
MDRFEKEAFFQSQSSGKDIGPPIDEDAVCSICKNQNRTLRFVNKSLKMHLKNGITLNGTSF